MLMRIFSTKEEEPMLKKFNTYIKSKMEYCCILWSLMQQKLLNYQKVYIKNHKPKKRSGRLGLLRKKEEA